MNFDAINTEEIKSFYIENGYAVINPVITDDELAEVRAEVEAKMGKNNINFRVNKIERGARIIAGIVIKITTLSLTKNRSCKNLSAENKKQYGLFGACNVKSKPKF